MGFQSVDQCFSDAGHAAAAVCGAAAQVTNSGYVSCSAVSFTGTTATLSMRLVETVAPHTVSSWAVAHEMVPCSSVSLADGITLGWGVGLVWVAVAAVLFMRRAMKG